MAITQSEKALRFQELHRRPGVLLIPNPWDAGSARIFEGLRFEVLIQIRQIVQVTNLPVAADLENGFGDEPAVVAETIRLASEAGAVGGSIEDAPRDKTKPPYDLAHATERVAATVVAARALPLPFILTARAEAEIGLAAPTHLARLHVRRDHHGFQPQPSAPLLAEEHPSAHNRDSRQHSAHAAHQTTIRM